MNPSVDIILTGGNLNIQPADASGVFGLVIAGAEPNIDLAPNGFALVKSKKQAKQLFAAYPGSVTNAVCAFYDEVSEGTPLYIFGSPDEQIEDIANIESGLITHLVNFSGKRVKAIGLLTFYSVDTITEGLDTRIHTVIPLLQEQANSWKQQNKPIEFLIEGKGYAGGALKNYATTQNTNVHCVLGAENGNTAISVVRALGRKAAFAVHRNIGRVKSGSLKIPTAAAVTLGNKAVGDWNKIDLGDIHDKGYITYLVNENAPGFIFNDDISLCDPTSDFSAWSRNAVIGEAQRIAYATYYRVLKDDFDVDDNGRLYTSDSKALEQDIEDAINNQIGNSISNVNAMVNPDPQAYAGLYTNANIDNPNFNLLSGGKIYVFLTIRPKGYIKDIVVALGFGY